MDWENFIIINGEKAGLTRDEIGALITSTKFRKTILTDISRKEKEEQVLTLINDVSLIKKVRLAQKVGTENKYDVIVIEPGSIKGVNIPCVLAIPENYNGKQKLTMCFNNEGGITLSESCDNIQRDIPKIIEGMDFKGPVIVPILPSKEDFDKTLQNEGIDFKVGEPKQFARECFGSKIPKTSVLYRIDEQVVRIIENINSNTKLIARIQQLRNKKDALEFDKKMIGFGHSGGGAAMLRFALIHPEKFETLIIGGNGDIVPTPFGENGKKLGYPFGVKEYSKLFGRNFSEEDYKKINFQFYIGDKEDAKPIYDTIRDENYKKGKTGPLFAPKKLADLYKSMYGTPFFERFKNALMQYESAGAKVGLKIYDNDCHSMITLRDLHGIIYNGKYFNSNCSEQLQTMLDKRGLKNVETLGSESFGAQKNTPLLDAIGGNKNIENDDNEHKKPGDE